MPELTVARSSCISAGSATLQGAGADGMVGQRSGQARAKQEPKARMEQVYPQLRQYNFHPTTAAGQPRPACGIYNQEIQ